MPHSLLFPTICPEGSNKVMEPENLLRRGYWSSGVGLRTLNPVTTSPSCWTFFSTFICLSNFRVSLIAKKAPSATQALQSAVTRLLLAKSNLICTGASG